MKAITFVSLLKKSVPSDPNPEVIIENGGKIFKLGKVKSKDGKAVITIGDEIKEKKEEVKETPKKETSKKEVKKEKGGEDAK